MKMNLDPETDREIFISLNGEVKQLRETIERFGASLLNLEKDKFGGHEIRISKLEKTENERAGMWKLILAVSILLTILSGVIAIKIFS